MFLHLSVSYSVHMGVCIPACIGADTARADPPADIPGQTPPLANTPCPVHAGIHTTPLPSACWDTHPLPPRTVRILLKCILVELHCFHYFNREIIKAYYRYNQNQGYPL